MGGAVAPGSLELAHHRQVACLALDGRTLVFALDELKLQPGGGKGLTLMDVDEKAPGAGFFGRRARKGHKVEGFVKVQRVI